jgi:uncharacterized protein YigE (DUF2233 family)
MLWSLCFSAAAANVGVEHVGTVDVAVCAVDLRKDRLALHWKSASGQIYGSLRALDAALGEQGKSVVCGTNGGIFDQTQKPLGLYIENGALLRRANLRRSGYGNFYLQPNGVFVLYAGRAEIVTTDEYQAMRDADKRAIVFANQSGPILVQRGQPNALFIADSANRTTRNAVCVREPQQVLLIVALDPINFYDFAHALAEHFGCQSALYLDGTLSTFYPSPRFALEHRLGVLFAVTTP